MAELIFTHGTASFMMFHIGEVPGYPEQPGQEAKDPPIPSNRKMIQENLYTLCLNALMIDDDVNSGDGTSA